jgi:hypothetical protein
MLRRPLHRCCRQSPCDRETEKRADNYYAPKELWNKFLSQVLKETKGRLPVNACMLFHTRLVFIYLHKNIPADY